MRTRLVLLALGIVLAPLPARAQGDDALAIREVIETAYVDGVFVSRDEAKVRAGFHPEFVLSVLLDGEILVVTLDEWLDRLALDGSASGEEVRHRIDRIDVTGDTAVVAMRLWIDGEHEYSDYMGLYRLPEGWRIVTKVFQGHD